LKPQRNAVLQAIKDVGLQLANFRWGEKLTEVAQHGGPPFFVQVLEHEPTGAAFAFDLDAEYGHHYAMFRPGRQGPPEGINAGDWPTELGYVRDWLQLVKAEHETPDLWAEVGKERELAGATGPGMGAAGETLFTPEERQVIAVQLREIKELIVGAAALNAAQIEELDERIEYVAAASHRLARRDWAGIFLSTIFSFAIEHSLGSPLVAEVLRLAAHGLGHLFGSGGFPELPGGGPSTGPM
jgi:hypothetical protein